MFYSFNKQISHTGHGVYLYKNKNFYNMTLEIIIFIVIIN